MVSFNSKYIRRTFIFLRLIWLGVLTILYGQITLFLWHYFVGGRWYADLFTETRRAKKFCAPNRVFV